MSGFFALLLLLLNGLICNAQVVKRSDDTDPLENVVSKLVSDVQSLQAQVVALHSGMDLLKVNVGFVTSVSHDMTVNSGAMVKFDTVQYDAGLGYNTATGFFTAPVSGLYSFFFKTETSADHQVGLQMIKEGERILYIYAYDHDTYQTPSAETVLHLAKGERIWVESTRTSSLIRSTWTRFGGFLVHADLPN